MVSEWGNARNIKWQPDTESEEDVVPPDRLLRKKDEAVHMHSLQL